MPVVTIRTRSCLAALIAVIALSGCSEQTWDWDWWKTSGTKKQQRPVTRAGRRTDQSKVAQRQPRKEQTRRDQGSNDEQADQVDAKVRQYVDTMEPTGRKGYQSNDFNAKIQRQDDRRDGKRIRKVTQRRPQQGEPAAEPAASPAARVGDPGSRSPGPAAGEPAVRPVRIEPQPAADDTGSIAPSESPPAVARSDRVPSGAAASTTDVAAAPTDTGRDDDPARPGVLPNTAAASGTDVRAALPESSAAEEQEKPAKAPVLEKIRISSGPEQVAVQPAVKQSEQPAALDGPADKPRSTANTAAPAPVQQVDTFEQRLKELEERVAKEPNDLEAQYKMRMMYMLAGQEDQALAPIEGANAEIQETIQAHFRALKAAQSNSGRDPAINANNQLEKIEELGNIIRVRADLRIPRVALCTAIDGFGRYTPIEPAVFQAGQKNRVLLYIEVDNFRSEKTASGMYRTLLSVRQSLLNKSGEELWSTHDANIEDLARQRRRDFYLTIGPLTIPKTLGPDEYVLKVEVEDVIGGKINSNVAKFTMIP